MSTRGIIGTAHDGGFTGRYLHSDAYPTWTGPQLLALYRRKHGSAQAVIDHLVKPGQGGYWSSLGDWTEIEEERTLVTDTDDVGAEWAWLLSERGIDVVAAMRATGTKAQGMFGGIGEIVWTHVGRVAWDASEVDWGRIECGEDLQRCIHCAYVHFPAAEGSRLGTAVWLGREQPGERDVSELIVNATGRRLKLCGSGSQGTAHDWRYDPQARVAYWWRIAQDGGWYRVFRCLKSGYRLDRDYTAVVVTAAGEQLIAPGTVLA